MTTNRKVTGYQTIEQDVSRYEGRTFAGATFGWECLLDLWSFDRVLLQSAGSAECPDDNFQYFINALHSVRSQIFMQNWQVFDTQMHNACCPGGCLRLIFLQLEPYPMAFTFHSFKAFFKGKLCIFQLWIKWQFNWMCIFLTLLAEYTSGPYINLIA